MEIHLSSSTWYNNNAKKLISLSFPVPARSPPHSHGLEAGEHLVRVLRLEHRVLRRHEAQPEADEGHQVSQGTLWLTLWGTPGWSWSTLAPPPSTGNTTAALCPPGTIARQRWTQNFCFLFSYFKFSGDSGARLGSTLWCVEHWGDHLWTLSGDDYFSFQQQQKNVKKTRWRLLI